MISVREYADVRLEVEFRVLAPALSILQDNFGRMPLSQFLEVWGPEIQDSQIMVRLITKENSVATELPKAAPMPKAKGE